jgi:hypothetical protein
LPVLERAIVALGGLKVEFTPETKVLIQHRVSLETHEQAAQTRRCLARGGARGRRAGKESAGVNTKPSCLVALSPETHGHIERALRAQQWGAKKQQCKGKVAENSFHVSRLLVCQQALLIRI